MNRSKSICRWCHAEFWQHPFSKLELREFREALLIADSGYVPVICDTCHETVINTAPRHLNPPRYIMQAA